MKNTKKKKNPNDTTMRNVNALKKRVKSLELHVKLARKDIAFILTRMFKK